MAKKKVSEQEYINSPLNNPMPNYAVYRMGTGESLIVRLLIFAAGGLVGLLFYGDLFMQDGVRTLATHISNAVVVVVVGLLAVKFMLPVYTKSRADKRRAVLSRQFRDMLESLATSFSSGSNVQRAFESAEADLRLQYGPEDLIVREIREINQGIAQNVNVDVMLRNFGKRSGNEDIVSFADVFTICYRKGGNMNTVIGRVHTVISDKMAVKEEIRTKLTSNKLQHTVMSLMPIGVVAMLKFSNDTFSGNFKTPIGLVASTVAIAIFVGAYLWGNKIVDVKE